MNQWWFSSNLRLANSAQSLISGGTLEEICSSERDMARGRHSEHPYLIVCQQSQFDGSRAPAGRQTGYAYCHVPPGSTVDRTDAIERQVEQFNTSQKRMLLDLKPGDIVTINDGPFAGYEAIFDGQISGKERVRVLLSFLQKRQIPVELRESQIGRAKRP